MTNRIAPFAALLGLLALSAGAQAEPSANAPAEKAKSAAPVRKIPVGAPNNLIRGNTNSDLPESSMCDPCDAQKLAQLQQHAQQTSGDDDVHYRHLRKKPR